MKKLRKGGVVEELRTRGLSYRRADFFSTSAAKTLGELFAESKKKHAGVQKFEYANGMIVEERHYKLEKVGPLVRHLVHIVAYTPGEEASIVPHSASDLKTAPPPKDADYLDGDIMFLVAGNDVIICSSNLHEKKVEFYLDKYFELAKIDPVIRNFQLKKIANVDKVKLIQSQGVKSISMNLSLYEASLEHIERKTVTTKLLGKAWDEFKTLVKKETGEPDLDKLENLTAHLVLKYDGRRKGIAIGKGQLHDVAKQMLDEEDDGFIIETVAGEKLKGNDIALKKYVDLQKDGKSVWYDDAWTELKAYYQELMTGGFLEQ